MTSPFDDRPSIRVRAILVAERIDLKAIERTSVLASAPLMISAGERGAAVLFRYGVVVTFDVAPLEEAALLQLLAPFLTDPPKQPETEEIELRIRPGAPDAPDSGGLRLASADLPRLQLVADVLARSVVLAQYETRVAAIFDRIEPLAVDMQNGVIARRQGKELLRDIGGTLIVQHKMVGRVEIEEKPDLLWDHADLERLWSRLIDEYDLRDRHRALDRKLQLIARTAETMHSLFQNRLALRVEWYIVALIVFEIVLSVVQMIFKV